MRSDTRTAFSKLLSVLAGSSLKFPRCLVGVEFLDEQREFFELNLRGAPSSWSFTEASSATKADCEASISLSESDLRRVVAGELNPQALYLESRIQTEGNVAVLQSLSRAFALLYREAWEQRLSDNLEH